MFLFSNTKSLSRNKIRKILNEFSKEGSIYKEFCCEINSLCLKRETFSISKSIFLQEMNALYEKVMNISMNKRDSNFEQKFKELSMHASHLLII